MIFLSLAAMQYRDYREAMECAFGISPDIMFGDMFAFGGTIITTLTYSLIGVVGDRITFGILMILFIVQSALHLYNRQVLSRLVIWAQVTVLLMYTIDIWQPCFFS